jgi:hypothetical protein
MAPYDCGDAPIRDDDGTPRLSVPRRDMDCGAVRVSAWRGGGISILPGGRGLGMYIVLAA